MLDYASTLSESVKIPPPRFSLGNCSVALGVSIFAAFPILMVAESRMGGSAYNLAMQHLLILDGVAALLALAGLFQRGGKSTSLLGAILCLCHVIILPALLLG